jgi:hypothetical protein
VNYAAGSTPSGTLSGRVAIEAIEQITYLLFLHRLDDLQLLAENQGRPVEQAVTKSAVIREWPCCKYTITVDICINNAT